ncbi:MAG: hypothetical protein OEM67_04405 [Thermoleophilia bacterium]|nr:hypothetical protein [Thermoleophilia bacterium]MDH3725057.1 hypothetical protein [Thermoleophilia bacterium]
MDGTAAGLAGRVTGWMAENREALDGLMTQEGSRAVHEEFIVAEGGVLPTREDRIERARRASTRAWLRHFGHGLAASWEGADPELGDRIETWMTVHGERREALQLDEEVAFEKLGRSGDPERDQRAVELAAQRRYFAEAVASTAEGLGIDPPELSRRVGSWCRENLARLKDLQVEALAAAPGVSDGDTQEMALLWERSPEAARAVEAAMVWANLRFLAEALEHALPRPE